MSKSPAKSSAIASPPTGTRLALGGLGVRSTSRSHVIFPGASKNSKLGVTLSEPRPAVSFASIQTPNSPGVETSGVSPIQALLRTNIGESESLSRTISLPDLAGHSTPVSGSSRTSGFPGQRATGESAQGSALPLSSTACNKGKSEKAKQSRDLPSAPINTGTSEAVLAPTEKSSSHAHSSSKKRKRSGSSQPSGKGGTRPFGIDRHHPNSAKGNQEEAQ